MISAAVAVLCFVWCWGWERGFNSMKRKVMSDYATHKCIEYENNTDSTYTVVTNFQYIDEDFIQFYPKMKSSYYNRIDTEFVWKWTTATVLIPSPKYDKLPFPDGFSIKIYNKNMSKLYKEYDYNAFIKEIQKDTVLKDINPLSLEKFTLKIEIE